MKCQIVGPEFKCPRCGSSYFNTDLPTRTGHCKGHLVPHRFSMTSYTGCDFVWPRVDDAKLVLDLPARQSGVGQ